MGRTAPLLSPPSLAELLAAGPVALFLDFDGTLVAIAPRPDAIHVPEGLGRRIERLADRLAGRLALVSGRALDDLGSHLGAVCVARAGSHGADRRWSDDSVLGGAPRGLEGGTIAEVETYARSHGLNFETKTHGCALHYRTRPEAGQYAESFMRAVASREGLAVKAGKCVVELVQPGADKGGAVRAFMAQTPFAGARAVFLGDDVTDEDGFVACAELGGFGILVGDQRETHANFRLSDVDAVHNWLEL
ncbi:trehalose-phosphatase [Erythrobacter sp. QSSC1-22B]|uniref:trehalose-phosphatase n=1 Tax=Erythrobacter sp. QSSC1-22B TaxID=1860125 RepID=UPI000804C526|nr:trehalose-phosphatase [Erythrobacter sp. QSSC1-22B]OBX18265.1 trehalose-phosphatase [Erythrobacter sp. QSSC1-22B]